MSLVARPAQNHPQQVAARMTGNDRRWHATDAIDDRATTPEVFGPLHARFRFTVDAAAAEHNAKLAHYFTREDDGLDQSWTGLRVWCNPPYSNIRPWVEKAWSEWSGRYAGCPVTRVCLGCRFCEHAKEAADNALIVMLLPANRTEQSWWQDLVEPQLRSRRPDFHVEFLRGRLRFLKPGESEVPPNSRPPFGCCLLIWGDR